MRRLWQERREAGVSVWSEEGRARMSAAAIRGWQKRREAGALL
jgi:hypothetical protein